MSEHDKNEAVVDPTSGLQVRKTDNGMKEGDLETPQSLEALKLDENGLPTFLYDHIERVM